MNITRGRFFAGGRHSRQRNFAGVPSSEAAEAQNVEQSIAARR
jgi:hypothetical protein